MQILFLEIAEKEFYVSQQYYEEQQTNLGNKFKSEVYSTLKRIQKFPNMFVKVKKDIRKCIVNKFPFNILYSIEGDYILVIAIANHHRNPDYWIDRIKN